MNETASMSATVAIKLGFLGWILKNCVWIIWSVALVVGALLVMLMQIPRSQKEWTAALISTVASSLFGGSALIEYFHLQSLLNAGYTGTLTVAGIIFVCALPGWTIVRWWFSYAEKTKNKSFVDVFRELRRAWKGDSNPEA